jgi:hypothetical protein
MGAARSKRDRSEVRAWIETGGWSLGDLLKSLMDRSGIPFSFRTRSAVGESALCVAGQSILTGWPLFLTQA